MSNGKSRLMVWCNDGANQRALCFKIAQEFNVIGIVREKRKRKRPKFFELINKLIDRIIFYRIGRAWQQLMRYYRMNYPDWPTVPILDIDYINKDEVFDFTSRLQPDIIVVSGTSLIKKKLLSLEPSIGIVNLHTGLSPYVKGGPNCTNWCIANDQWHLIGNTIMWINSGIDSGNIITTKSTNIEDCKDLFEIHKKVMDEAHLLYIRALHYLENSSPPYISIPQNEIIRGQLYLTKMWNNRKKWQLLKNLKKFKKGKHYIGHSATVIDLPA